MSTCEPDISIASLLYTVFIGFPLSVSTLLWLIVLPIHAYHVIMECQSCVLEATPKSVYGIYHSIVDI